jgi:hypothetical protein
LYSLTGIRGVDVDAAGDVDLDGFSDIAIRTEVPNSSGASSFRAQIRSGVDGSLLLNAPMQGNALDAGFDVNRDGYNDLVVGESGYSIGPNAVGRVVFLSGSPTPPLTYCQGKTNSLGCVPYAWASGSTSLSGPNNLVVRCANILNNKLGIMFWGRQANSAPFLGGTLCIGTPFFRTGSMVSGGTVGSDDCSGSFAMPFTHAMMNQNGLNVGSSVYCQFWHRDPGYPAPANVGLTDGVVFTVSF